MTEAPLNMGSVLDTGTLEDKLRSFAELIHNGEFNLEDEISWYIHLERAEKIYDGHSESLPSALADMYALLKHLYYYHEKDTLIRCFMKAEPDGAIS